MCCRSFQGKNKTKLKGSLLKSKTVVSWQEATSTEINVFSCTVVCIDMVSWKGVVVWILALMFC